MDLQATRLRDLDQKKIIITILVMNGLVEGVGLYNFQGVRSGHQIGQNSTKSFTRFLAFEQVHNHPAGITFLLLLDFVVLGRLCMNRVRSSLSMRCMLPGYSLEPKPNMPDLVAILVFHGTAGSIITIGSITKRMLAPEKRV